MSVIIRHGDCREVLRTLPDESVHCCVTSPPYFGLRDYGVAGQIGLEPTPDAFVAEMVDVFREVRRVLRADGTLWLNLGDSYAASGRGGNPDDSPHQKQASNRGSRQFFHEHMVDAGVIGRKWVKPPAGYKQKDLLGIPWLVAFALRTDGWYLRQDIIWSKPNPMPESVQDRCTKAHEYIFLLSKGPKYHYDADSIAEAVVKGAAGSEFHVGKTAEHQLGRASTKPRRPTSETKLSGAYSEGAGRNDGGGHRSGGFIHAETRNKRSVWEVTTQPFAEAHFATFPPALIEPCIKAGCPTGGIVLDPFGGAGTTGLVADRLARNAILIELNPEYTAIAERRIRGDAGMFAEVSA